MAIKITEELTDQQLLEQIAAGDEISFQALYRRYSGRVYLIANKYLNSTFSAQDVVQDIFCKIWQAGEQLLTIQTFPAWLTTVTRNHVFTQLQKQIPLLSIDELEHGQIACEGNCADAKELEKFINEAVMSLSPRQKEIYCLSRIENLSHKQISSRLGISYDVTREHMSKALKSIRLFLQNKYLIASYLGVLVFVVKIFS